MNTVASFQRVRLRVLTCLAWSFIISITVYADDWTRIPTGTNDLYEDCVFTDARTGWVVGEEKDGVFIGVVMSTTDGGSTWKRQVIDSLGLTCIYRVSDRVLLIGGGGGVMYRSSDLGASWVKIRTGVKCIFTKILFRDSLNGFATGYYGAVLRTTDGGSTWSECTRIATADSTIYDVHDMFFQGDDLFVAADLKILRSTDDGTSWSVVPTTFKDEEMWYAGIVSLGSRVLCVMASGSVYSSSDGCRTWTTLTPMAPGAFNVVFRDSLNGFACGQLGFLQKTSDGGHTWTNVGTGTQSYLTMVSMVDSSVAYCVGKDGVVLRSVPTTTDVREHVPPDEPIMNETGIVIPDDGYVSLDRFRREATVEVYTATGIRVLHAPVQERLYLGHLAPGVYVLHTDTKRMFVVKP